MFKTSWLDFNELVGDSFKKGNVVLIGSDEYSGRSSFSMGLIDQFIRYNKLTPKSTFLVTTSNDVEYIPSIMGYQLSNRLSKGEVGIGMSDEDLSDYFYTYLDDKDIRMTSVSLSKGIVPNLSYLYNFKMRADIDGELEVALMDMPIDSDLQGTMRLVKEKAKALDVMIVVVHPMLKGRFLYDDENRSIPLADIELTLTMMNSDDQVGLIMKINREDDKYIKLPIDKSGVILDNV